MSLSSLTANEQSQEHNDKQWLNEWMNSTHKTHWTNRMNEWTNESGQINECQGTTEGIQNKQTTHIIVNVCVCVCVYICICASVWILGTFVAYDSKCVISYHSILFMMCVCSMFIVYIIFG